MNNRFFKFLSSLPIILIVLYFIPFLGICLILLRYFMNNERERIKTPISLTIIGLLLVVPKVIYAILKLIKIDTNVIPYLNDIINSDIYINIINYSKLLVCTGIIFLIIAYVLKIIFNKISNKLNNGIRKYINETERRNAEIAKKNDMEIKLKQEKARNTSYVHCPYCGSDNILSDKIGVCSFCRRKIVNKNYKG